VPATPRRSSSVTTLLTGGPKTAPTGGAHPTSACSTSPATAPTDTPRAATAHSADDGLVAVRLCAFGRTRVRYGRFRKPGEINASQGRANAWLIGTTQFEALDPRTFADDVHIATTGRVLPGTGFTPPFAVPFTLGASSSGSVAVINAGNAPAPWTARLDGPLTNPTITYVEIGRRLAFQANGGLDLASGDYLELSTTGRSALLAGVSDRRTQLTIDSDWWELGPGSATFRLDADAGNGLLTITVVDAFYS
jgi:hypothetical protein